MHTGSCLCGAVRFEIDGEIGAAYCCHCSRCRKSNGSAFAVNAPVAAADFRVVAGAEGLKMFSTAAGVHRSFCGTCCSPIYSRNESYPDIVRIRLGTLDGPVSGPRMHVFAASRAEWYEIHDGLPQHAERPAV